MEASDLSLIIGFGRTSVADFGMNFLYYKCFVIKAALLGQFSFNALKKLLYSSDPATTLGRGALGAITALVDSLLIITVNFAFGSTPLT